MAEIEQRVESIGSTFPGSLHLFGEIQNLLSSEMKFRYRCCYPGIVAPGAVPGEVSYEMQAWQRRPGRAVGT